MVTANQTSSVTKQIEELFTGASTLETTDLELFMQKIGQLIAYRKFPTVSERESELLLKINNVIPSSWQDRFALLSEKLNAEIITPLEHKELLKLVDKLEIKYAKRLEYLIELAYIRNITLDQLMRQLHLNLDQDDD